MIRARFNPRSDAADSLLEKITTNLTPSAWITQATGEDDSAYIVLLGAADLIGFRLREAQSFFRADALPAFFSHAALALRTGGALSLFHVPLISTTPGSVPKRNGIEPLELASLDAVPHLYPNLAVLHVALPNVLDLAISARNLGQARLSDDLVSPIPAWLAYVWRTAGCTNPLLEGMGIPSAMFVESCFSACDLDVVPGISQRVVCPEAIWQAARFWPRSLPQVRGQYELRQPEAAAAVEY